MRFQRRRLQKLADFLRTVPRARFNMKSWLNGKFCHKPNEPMHLTCGATACAFGWACTIPSFRRAGLRMEETLRYGTKDDWFGTPTFQPKGSILSVDNFEAATAFFGITSDEALQLFALTYLDQHRVQDTPNVVARRIEHLIATHST